MYFPHAHHIPETDTSKLWDFALNLAIVILVVICIVSGHAFYR